MKKLWIKFNILFLKGAVREAERSFENDEVSEHTFKYVKRVFTFKIARLKNKLKCLHSMK